MVVDIFMIKCIYDLNLNSYFVLNLCVFLLMFYCIEDNNCIYILFE